jgi:general secretion pathway protein G
MGSFTVSGNRPVNERRGFTLIEIMVVVAIIVTILSIAVPFYTTAMVRAKESVLQSNLFTMRSVIDQYTYDKEEPPQSLDQLVSEGYLREIPIDPFTESRDTWEMINDAGPTGESGLYDVRSGSERTALNGTPYKEW